MIKQTGFEKTTVFLLGFIFSASLVSACGNSEMIEDESNNSDPADTDTDSDTDSDTDTDTDSDTDTDTDSDTDTDTDSDTDTNTNTDNDTGLTWLPVSGGTFQMGGETVNGGADQLPEHSVTVQTFEMTKSEVTVSQYGKCVDDGICSIPNSNSYGCTWGAIGGENLPTNCVTWYQADEFCTWAEGRLPTEAEWEFAASNGAQEDAYPWGNEQATCDYAVMNSGNPVGDACGEIFTWDVCSIPLGNTSHGLCDMAGNVWEWLQDWHHSSYNGAPIDGSAWVDPIGTKRVMRGGALNVDYYWLFAIDRAKGNPDDDFWHDLGFRCAKDVE